MPAKSPPSSPLPHSTPKSHPPPRSISIYARLSHRIARRYRRSYLSLKNSSLWREVPRIILAAVLIVSLWRAASRVFVPTDSFDDEADMDLFESRRSVALIAWMNHSRSMDVRLHPSDPSLSYNQTEHRSARKQWNYVFRELTRRSITPTLTKYQKRKVREMYYATRLVPAPKLKANQHTSCNYMDDIKASDPLSEFSCAPTSHKCPDGGFTPMGGFVPAEGFGVSWEDVVIVMMVGEGREEYLQALADTWVSKLHPAATLVLACDNGLPIVPEALRERPNVIEFHYAGPSGLDNLDMKAITTWKYVWERFEKSNKKYFLKIDDDTYLVAHNLMRFLTKLDRMFVAHDEPLYFGHPFCGHGDLAALDYARWCYAGGGAYGLNLEALGMMVQQILDGCSYFTDYVKKAPNNHPEDDAYGGRYEDVMVGRCLREAAVYGGTNGTSLLACGSFFPYSPLRYYESFDNNLSAMTRKLGDSYITLHNIMPSAMRYLDDFLFDFPIGGTAPFSLENPRLTEELLRICRLEGKKMYCDMDAAKIDVPLSDATD